MYGGGVVDAVAIMKETGGISSVGSRSLRRAGSRGGRVDRYDPCGGNTHALLPIWSATRASSVDMACGV